MSIIKNVLIGALAAATVAIALPTVIIPQSAKSAIQASILPEPQTVNRASKADRESPDFAVRWEAVEELQKQNHPALQQWMADHGVLGGTSTVAKGD